MKFQHSPLRCDQEELMEMEREFAGCVRDLQYQVGQEGASDTWLRR